MTSKSKGNLATTVLGFRGGTKTNTAAMMYLRKNGATNKEIKDKNGQEYLNLLKKVVARGHTVTKTLRKVKGKDVKVYHIILK